MTNGSEINPYVGPRPFEKKESALFFGRDREAGDLFSLIVSHLEVLFYAQSGAGKTSLVNAKLIPLLEQEGFEVLPLARVRGPDPNEGAARLADNVFALNCLLGWVDFDTNPWDLVHIPLSEFLSKRPHGMDGACQPAPRVILFDQFEELFMFYPERWRDRRPFFEQIRAALQEDYLLRVVFVMREDYLAELDPFISLLPGRARARIRLERLREKAALTAVTEPLRGTNREFAPGVAEQLVEELRRGKLVNSFGSVETIVGEFIEPAQLQAVCQRLWQSMPAGATVITEEHLQKFGDVEQVLLGFYEHSLSKARERCGVTVGRLRRWFEQELITDEGTRGTVVRGRDKTAGIPTAAVLVLENEHLLRSEWRGGARWYELSHDRFIEAILHSNVKWRVRRRQRINRTLAAFLILVVGGSFAGWRLYLKPNSQPTLTSEISPGPGRPGMIGAAAYLAAGKRLVRQSGPDGGPYDRQLLWEAFRNLEQAVRLYDEAQDSVPRQSQRAEAFALKNRVAGLLAETE